ncbi:MAG TPA: hypothetical protein VFG11_00555 [Acidobacteriota bacterium]|nr:hypothetical protein [Acidobacteriota bacterium]
MILVRNVFHLKFGKAKDGIALFKEGLAINKRLGYGGNARILTDAVSRFYTLVYETTHDSLSELEEGSKKMSESDEWKSWYQKVIALVNNGYREVFNIVE